MTKTDVRKAVQLALRDLPDRQKRSGEICRAFLSLPQVKRADSVGLFLSMPTEPDTAPLFTDLAAQGKRLFAPRIEGDTMFFVEVKPDTTFLPNRYGIAEPQGEPFTGAIDLIAVPLVAFDQNNNRLGHGKGYYDRYLAAHPFSFTVGLAFAEQNRSFPVDPFDVPLDTVLSR